jgi:hypothetical protein
MKKERNEKNTEREKEKYINWWREWYEENLRARF